MTRDSVRPVCAGRGWRLLLAAVLSALSVAVLLRFDPAFEGRAQDQGQDPPRGVENVPIERIKSMIASTPANQLRNPTTASLPAQRYDSFEKSATWTAGHSIVLIHGSMTGVPLTALDGSGNPQPEAKWKVIRNPDDSPALQEPPHNGNLTVNPASGATTTLSLDKFGSFSAVAYIDTNSDGDYNQGEPAVFFNIVVCQVMFVSNHCEAYSNRIVPEFLTGVNYMLDWAPQPPCEAFQVSFGKFALGQMGMYLDAELAVAGGGANGQIGLERVFAGWTQTCSRWQENGTYANNHSATAFLPDVDVPAIPTYTTAALPQQHHPALNPALAAAKPLLDTTEENPGTGGSSICVFPGGENVIPYEFGQIRHAWAYDSPNVLIVNPHPKFPGSNLTQYDLSIDFNARLVLWTQARSGVRAGATLYMCAYEVPWVGRATYNQFNWAANPHTCTEVTKSIAINTKVKHEPPVRLDAVQAEPMPPVLNDRLNLIDANQ